MGISERHSGKPIQDGSEEEACELARRWVDAFNSREAAALIALADEAIAFHPTVLSGGKNVYHGHDGLERWLADLAALDSQHSAQPAAIRCSSPGEVLITGEIMLSEDAVSPFSMWMCLKDGKFVEAHAYLSDEATLTSLGHLGPG